MKELPRSEESARKKTPGRETPSAFRCTNHLLDLFEEAEQENGSKSLLQLMLFHGQGLMLARHGRLLFSNRLHALTLGPAVPQLINLLSWWQWPEVPRERIALKQGDLAEVDEVRAGVLEQAFLDLKDDNSKTGLQWLASHGDSNPWEAAIEEKGPAALIQPREIRRYYLANPDLFFAS